MKIKQKPILFVVLLTIVVGGVLMVFTTRTKRTTPFAAKFVSTAEIKHTPTGPPPEGMVWISGGEFEMGSDDRGEALCSVGGVTRDAQPIHRVYVDGFWMDKTEVTNEQFEEFAKATGNVTIAERAPSREEFPTAPPENLVAGSVVFKPTDETVRGRISGNVRSIG